MRVILAYDQSPASDVAAMYLLRLPFDHPVDLQIVTVVQPFPFSENQANRMNPRVVELLNLERQQAKAKLADLVAHFQNHTFRSVSAEVIDGGPAHALTEFADEQGTDLIVMGAVGRSALKRIDAEHIVYATLRALGDSSDADTARLTKAMQTLGIDSTGMDPVVA